jgi:ribosomal protein L40E
VIDTDLFQIVTLVLLLLALVVGLVTLSTVGRIRKQQEEGGAVSPSSAAWSDPQAAVAAPMESASAHPLDQSYGAAVQPAAATPATAAQPVTGGTAVATSASDPQDQPFERDGRWWFKRGDELLVYDEATGQWQPTGGAAPATGATTPMPAAAAAAGAEVGAHWKCPTCGAVNGSTATSCRMCFTARP